MSLQIKNTATQCTGIAFIKKKTQPLLNQHCKAALYGKFSFKSTSTLLFNFHFRIFIFLLTVMCCMPPPVCRVHAKQMWSLNFFVVLIRVCSEVGLFQQPANGSWPHSYYSPTYIFTASWRVVRDHFGSSSRVYKGKCNELKYVLCTTSRSTSALTSTKVG